MADKYPPWDWRNKTTQEALAVYDRRISAIEEKYIKLMATHIRQIGRMKASDITRLNQMRLASRNINEVQKEIAKLADISYEELQDVFQKTCEFEGNDFLKEIVKAGNINWKNNDALATALAAQIKVTQGTMKNFSNTTVVSNGYVQAVDKAILAVQSGMTDYNSAIREAVKKCASEGLRVVEYKSGYKRRLDSAFRQNLLDGMRDLAQERLNIIGEQTGCDGVEVSAHFLCAEDHLDVQGQQFSNDEYEVAHWDLIPSNRDIGMWNCHHWLTPIVMGISPKTYGQDTLDYYKQYSREPITITNSRGEEITKSRYQWSQEQRRLETAVRKQKDLRTAAKALGNTDGVNQANAQINKYKAAYKKIEDATGLVGERGRMTSWQGGGNVTNPRLTNEKNSYIISNEAEKARLPFQSSNVVNFRHIDDGLFWEKFNNLTDNETLNNTLYDCSVEILKHRSGTNYEDLYLINAKSGELIHALKTCNIENGVVYDEQTRKIIEDAHKNGVELISLHNHPKGTPPSLDDGSSAFRNGYEKGYVIGHNLEVFEFGKADNDYSLEDCNAVHEFIAEESMHYMDYENELWYPSLKLFGMSARRIKYEYGW